MVRRGVFTVFLLLLGSRPSAPQQVNAELNFEVTYVGADSVYVNGGREEGLAQGMELDIFHHKPGEAAVARQLVGRVRVFAVASHSAACKILDGAGSLTRGDEAVLAEADAQLLRYLARSRNTRRYAQVVTFTGISELDPLEEEQREYVPRPPLPEINRVRGMISFEQNSLFDHTSGSRSHYSGVAVRADMTRIGGSFWNLRGYWRGRLHSRGSGSRQETIRDLLSRTYTFAFTYDNPHSRNVLGFGRLLLPWASSLSTLDGGYYGRRLRDVATVGVFGGSTPDPTAWDYDPNRQILGVFSSFQAGRFDSVRYSGTVGLAHTRHHWRAERQFLFMENGFFAGRKLSVYQSMEIDYRSKGRFGSRTGGPVLTRSFVTLRYRANEIVSLDLGHNYFRPAPTFDFRLIGTGLLDRFLYQGVTGGVRIELPHHSVAYGSVGRSHRKSDSRPSWNYLAGITLGTLPFLDVRTDLRTSRFASSFGSGRYVSLTFTRDITESMRLQIEGGRQTFQSPLTDQNRAHWFNIGIDWLPGAHYLVTAGFTIYGGELQRYDQLFLSLGYRF